MHLCVFYYPRLDTTQLIPFTISPFLDPSPVTLQAITQFSALTVTSMYLVAGLSDWIMDQEAALSTVRPVVLHQWTPYL